MSSIDLQALSARIAYITINPSGSFLRSAQAGFGRVGLQPEHLIYVRPLDRLFSELKRHKLGIVERVVVPKLQQRLRRHERPTREAQHWHTPRRHTVSRLNSDDTVRVIRTHNIKYLINCGAGLFGRQLIDMPGLIILNAHAGKLPDYKNMGVVEWAICNGEPVVGTVHRIEEGIDSGPIWLETVIDVSRQATYMGVREYCFSEVSGLLGQAVLANEEGSIIEKPQQPKAGRRWYRMHSYFQRRTEQVLQRQHADSLKSQRQADGVRPGSAEGLDAPTPPGTPRIPMENP